MEKNRSALFAVLLFITAVSVSAHLDKTSLSVKGGETFTAGDTVTVTWKIAVPHHVPIIVYFSPDPDSGWKVLDTLSEPANSVDMSYRWVVPAEKLEMARLRIFQRLNSIPSTKTDDYTLISGEFSITMPVTAIAIPAAARHMVRSIASDAGAKPVDLLGRSIVQVPSGSFRTVRHREVFFGTLR